MQHDEKLARLAAGLLVAATLLFFIGVTVERLPAQAQPITTASPTPRAPSESAEQIACERAGGSEESCAKSAATTAPGGQVREAASEPQEGSPEREAAERAAGVQEATIVGVPAESPAAIGLVVVLSLMLAAALWFRPWMIWLLLLALGFAVVTGIFDVREVPFQLARANLLLVALATLAGVLHATTAAVAGLAARKLMIKRAGLAVLPSRGRECASAR